MTPFGQKFLWTVLALVVGGAAKWVGGEGHEFFLMAAATIFGAVWVRRPGDAAPQSPGPKGPGTMRAAGIIAVMLLPLAGCKHWPTVQQDAIDCSRREVVDNGPRHIAPVNTCLARKSGVAACLGGLIGSVGIDIVACVVKERLSVFTAQAAVNPFDPVSARARDNAVEWLDAQDITFAE